MTLLCKVREQESLCRGLRRPDLVSFSLRGSEFISNDNEGPKIGPKFRASIMRCIWALCLGLAGINLPNGLQEAKWSLLAHIFYGLEIPISEFL